MKAFPLQIVTPQGLVFDDHATFLSVRTTSGEIGILAGHTDYAGPLAQGGVCVHKDGNVRKGACSSGVLTVLKGKVTLLSGTFQWSDTDQSSQ